MSRPQRFPRKLEFWTNDAQGDAIDRLEAAGLLNRADHLRQALQIYLYQIGELAVTQAAPNGQHHEEARDGV